MESVELSICFCAWNEEGNIGDCIDDALRAVPLVIGAEKNFEILVIDNASTDRTPDVVRAYSVREPRVRLIRHPENRYYSGSHRTAFQEAKGRYVAIMDGDHQHTAKDIAKGMRLIDEHGCDVVFGWKKTRHDGVLRQIFSVGLRWTSQFLIGHELHDINCGFRVFRQDAVKQIQISERINSVGPEIFCECRRLNLAVGEMVVEHFARVKGEGLHDSIMPLLRNTKRFLDYLLRLRSRYSACPRLSGTKILS